MEKLQKAMPPYSFAFSKSLNVLDALLKKTVFNSNYYEIISVYFYISLSYKVAGFQRITSCLKNCMTTRVITLRCIHAT